MRIPPASCTFTYRDVLSSTRLSTIYFILFLFVFIARHVLPESKKGRGKRAKAWIWFAVGGMLIDIVYIPILIDSVGTTKVGIINTNER